MLDGRVYVLTGWRFDPTEQVVFGSGHLLNVNRDTLAEGSFSVLLDSVAIFETNRAPTSPAVAAMAIVTGVSGALTFYCLANPKACFGSCPTFYVDGEQKGILQAEGFSRSVAPSLEAWDIDALYRAEPAGRESHVKMKNEALETHVVRQVDLLVVPRDKGERVFVTPDGAFWQATRVIGPSRCQAPEGNCLKQLQSFDGLERISQTDSTFLGAKETIELEFLGLPSGKLGLVVASRQSLLSTYLFYQGLAYMGSAVGEWMAGLERGDRLFNEGIDRFTEVLGGIEVLEQHPSEGWTVVGELGEPGPLATDVKIVPLPDSDSSSRRVRLRLTKGQWRLDWLAIAAMEKEVKPLELPPFRVRNDAVEHHKAREILTESLQALVTLPGDTYVLSYLLPNNFESYEIFLQSRGYYIEWIRDEWLVEENPARAAIMFMNPTEALKLLAPEFKQIEGEMEEAFWNSRYAR